MRYALIIAGGSGTRLWPMSRRRLPKQLIPFLDGRSLLDLALERLEGLIEPSARLVCANQAHQDLIVPKLGEGGLDRFYGEPEGRDTLNAIALVAAHLARRDPQAVLGVFTADHVIQPIDQFRRIVAAGYAAAEQLPTALVTFGITPTYPATGYGYLELGPELTELGPEASVEGQRPRRVLRFKEKPDPATAAQYLAAGPQRYLWNSGMFVWGVQCFLEALKKFAPAHYGPILELACAWDSPRRPEALARLWPTLPRISVDYAVMEPASADPAFQIVAVPMPLDWLDVGSWPSFAQVLSRDEHGNAIAPRQLAHILHDSTGNLLVSEDPQHLIAVVGCQNLIIVHTADATLVCQADHDQDIKKIHNHIIQRWGQRYT